MYGSVCSYYIGLIASNSCKWIHSFVYILWCACDVIKIFATLDGFSHLVILMCTKISEAHYIAIRKTPFMWALKSGSRSCWCFMAVFFYIEIYPTVSSYLTALVCSIRSLRRSGRRRPRLPMRGGSNWLSSASRLRRQPKRSWDLSWRFLPRSSTRSCAFASVLWNIWSIVLNSLVKVCDSILSGKPCCPSTTPILNTFSSREWTVWFIRCVFRILRDFKVSCCDTRLSIQ